MIRRKPKIRVRSARNGLQQISFSEKSSAEKGVLEPRLLGREGESYARGWEGGFQAGGWQVQKPEKGA